MKAWRSCLSRETSVRQAHAMNITFRSERDKISSMARPWLAAYNQRKCQGRPRQRHRVPPQAQGGERKIGCLDKYLCLKAEMATRLENTWPS